MCLCSPYIFVKIREKEKKRMEQIYRIAIDQGYGINYEDRTPHF